MGRLRAKPGASESVAARRTRVAAVVVIALGLSGALLVGHTAAQSPLPGISALDTTVPEGGPEGTDATASIPVVLSAASTQVVSVDWRTVDGTAEGGPEPNADGPDYYSGNGTVTFAPGQTEKRVEIRIDGGSGPEPDETFTVELANPTNATLIRAIATVTIANDDVPPPPDSGEVNVIPTDGGGQCVALYKEPGCQPLAFGEQLPIDEIKYINPRSSKVTVRSIAGIGTFYGGRFSVKETGDAVDARSASSALAKPVLVVNLVGGNFKTCGTTRSLSGVEATKKPVRQLWGKGKGRFRTRGRYASGTVRGTNWVTQDYCNGTSIRVVSGIVQVRDFVSNKIFLLKRGQSHFAKAPTG